MFVRAANLITIGGRVLSLVSRIHSVAVAVSSPIHSYMKSIALWAIVVAFSGRSSFRLLFETIHKEDLSNTIISKNYLVE